METTNNNINEKRDALLGELAAINAEMARIKMPAEV